MSVGIDEGDSVVVGVSVGIDEGDSEGAIEGNALGPLVHTWQ